VTLVCAQMHLVQHPSQGPVQRLTMGLPAAHAAHMRQEQAGLACNPFAIPRACAPVVTYEHKGAILLQTKDRSAKATHSLDRL
jgi:hypothetical protein